MSFLYELKDLAFIKSSPQRRLPQKLALNESVCNDYLTSSIINPKLSQLSLLNYRSDPKVRTRSELINIRKAETTKHLATSTSSVYLNPSNRVKQREQKFINNSGSQENSLLERRKERKNQDLANFEQKFSCNVYGIHKSELPKFYGIKDKLFHTQSNYLMGNEQKLPEKNSINETKACDSFQIISNKLDTVEFNEMKRNANFMLDNFTVLKDLTLSPYFQRKLDREETIKQLRRSIRYRKSLLIQTRIIEPKISQNKSANKGLMRTSGFV